MAVEIHLDHLLLPGALALQSEFHCRIGVIRKNLVNSQPRCKWHHDTLCMARSLASRTGAMVLL